MLEDWPFIWLELEDKVESWFLPLYVKGNLIVNMRKSHPHTYIRYVMVLRILLAGPE